MANYDELIAVLNQAVSLEYTAVLQYNQHSMLVTGQEKRIFEEVFRSHSKEALDHAKLWGEKIVFLGGVPSVEVGTVYQSTDVREMLEMDLELETKAVEVYSRARKVCNHEPTTYLLEDQIVAEQEDVEELQKYLGKVKLATGEVKLKREVS